MTKLIKELIRFIIFLAFVGGGFLVYRSYERSQQKNQVAQKSGREENLDSKSQMLKKYLTSGEKPLRIEVTNLSKRFEQEVENFKKMKIPQDKNSNFYLAIQFFTDESDSTAPLIAQVRYIDVKSGNTLKEESINLE